jgi:site-specific recombinase XerD
MGSWENLRLKEWALKAGITKNVTFHVFRHTFATLQLTLGTDLYTVSKMLGHKSLRTTQIYAKVIDQKKKEAANKITI